MNQRLTLGAGLLARFYYAYRVRGPILALCNLGHTMKSKRWIYKVYYANRFVASFTSRVKAREFMETMTDLDIPFLITPDIAGQVPTMIGTLK